MSDNVCPKRPTLRLESDYDIRDAVESLLSSGEVKNASQALKLLLRRGISMSNNDSEILKLLLKYQVHALALGQRQLGVVDEKLIEKVRGDAQAMYEKIMESFAPE